MVKNLLPAPEPSLTLHGSKGAVTSLTCISTGALAGHLISGSVYAFVYLWDTADLKRLVCEFQCDTNAAKNTSVLWTHVRTTQDHQLFIQMRDGAIHKWNITAAQPVELRRCLINEQHGFCPGIALPDYGALCVPAGQVADNSSGLVLLSEESLLPVGALAPSANHFSPMRIARYKEHGVVVAYEDAVVTLWDVRSQKSPVILSSIFRGKEHRKGDETAETSQLLDNKVENDLITPMALDVDSSSNAGILGSSSNKLHRFEITSTELLLKADLTLPDEGVSDVRIRPDGRIFTVASWDHTARVYSWAGLKPLAVLDIHRDTVQRVDYMQFEGRNSVVLGGKDKMISIWPLY